MGTAPPARPDRPPCGVTDWPAAEQSFMTADTSSTEAGRATANGVAAPQPLVSVE